MDQQGFKQAKLFAFTDVKRELALAIASETDAGKAALQTAGVELGGGNFMAALAPLLYGVRRQTQVCAQEAKRFGPRV